MRGTRFAELSAFIVVAERNSFTKAASQLGISTATLSQSIKALEEGLGVRLFNRTTRSVNLTEVGSRLLGRLKPALLDYEAAVESVNAFRDKPSGALRLSVLPPAAEFLIAPILPQFLTHYPDLRVEISTEAALTDIVAERFDAGIRFGRRVERDMVAVRISDDVHTIVVAAPEYLARHGTPNRPEDLHDHNCIHLRFPSGAMLPWRFRRKGERVEVGVEGSVIVNDPRMGVSLAADGVGVVYTIVPYVAPLLAQEKLVTILDGWMPQPDAYYLYYPSRKQNPAALEALVDFIKRKLKASGAGPRRGLSRNNP
jgi:DNA-binding transcriptional LysR family regulator